MLDRRKFIGVTTVTALAVAAVNRDIEAGTQSGLRQALVNWHDARTSASRDLAIIAIEAHAANIWSQQIDAANILHGCPFEVLEPADMAYQVRSPIFAWNAYLPATAAMMPQTSTPAVTPFFVTNPAAVAPRRSLTTADPAVADTPVRVVLIVIDDVLKRLVDEVTTGYAGVPYLTMPPRVRLSDHDGMTMQFETYVIVRGGLQR